MLNRKQQGYQKSDSGEKHYYVGYLGKTRISLPEYLISDHRHLMVTMYQPDVNEGKPQSSNGRKLSADTPRWLSMKGDIFLRRTGRKRSNYLAIVSEC